MPSIKAIGVQGSNMIVPHWGPQDEIFSLSPKSQALSPWWRSILEPLAELHEPGAWDFNEHKIDKGCLMLFLFVVFFSFC